MLSKRGKIKLLFYLALDMDSRAELYSFYPAEEAYKIDDIFQQQ